MRSEAGQSSRSSLVGECTKSGCSHPGTQGSILLMYKALLDENRADLEYRHDE
jgi:hypothetical protein